MFNKIFIFFLLAVSVAAAFAGCDSNPTGKLLNPSGSYVTVNANSWPNSFIIYQNQLTANMGVSFFTTQQGQVADFNSTESVAPGSIRSIKYSWDGSQVTPYNADGSLGTPTYAWAGFGLQVLAANGSPTTKDVTPGAYNYIHFKVKGSLGSNIFLRVEVTQTAGANPFDVYWQSNPGDSQITSSWQTVNYYLQGNGSNANKLQYYVVVTFQNLNPTGINGGRGNGGTVYLDEIEFTQSPLS